MATSNAAAPMAVVDTSAELHGPACGVSVGCSVICGTTSAVSLGFRAQGQTLPVDVVLSCTRELFINEADNS